MGPPRITLLEQIVRTEPTEHPEPIVKYPVGDCGDVLGCHVTTSKTIGASAGTPALFLMKSM
jgi:hypothetical protein